MSLIAFTLGSKRQRTCSELSDIILYKHLSHKWLFNNGTFDCWAVCWTCSILYNNSRTCLSSILNLWIQSLKSKYHSPHFTLGSQGGSEFLFIILYTYLCHVCCWSVQPHYCLNLDICWASKSSWSGLWTGAMLWSSLLWRGWRRGKGYALTTLWCSRFSGYAPWGHDRRPVWCTHRWTLQPIVDFVLKKNISTGILLSEKKRY